MVHHRWSNLRGSDFVWVPLDFETYSVATALVRLLVRVERTTLGLALYASIETWWQQQIRARDIAQLTDEQRRDRRLAWAWLSVTVAVAAMGSSRVHDGVWFQPITAIIGLSAAVLVPFFVTMWFQGFGTLYNHTDPAVPWFADEETWSSAGAGVTCAVHVTFPRPLCWLVGNAFYHPAHHVDPRIPLPNLPAAQHVLATAMPSVVHRQWSIRHHRDVLRTCRLYDYRTHRWVDFDGRPTTGTIWRQASVGPAVESRMTQTTR
jgi:acyl-lipid omega-6 desaturase (Delta-12 desaturase)